MAFGIYILYNLSVLEPEVDSGAKDKLVVFADYVFNISSEDKYIGKRELNTCTYVDTGFGRSVLDACKVKSCKRIESY